MSKNVFVLTKKFISFALLFIMIIGVFSSFFILWKQRHLVPYQKIHQGHI